MKNIPRYWAYAETDYGNWIWRSSGDSEADAKDEAKRAARRISLYERAESWEDRPPSEDYPYGVTLREKLLEEINDSSGELQAFITRNHAGAKVLNARNVLFLDWDTPTVDYPSLKGCLLGLFAWIGQFFGRQSEPIPELKQVDPLRRNPKTGVIGCEKPNPEWEARTTEDWEEQYPWAAKPELWEFMKRITKMSDWSVRIYKTAAGYRGIVTHSIFSPTDPDILCLMNEFGCDPLYVRLCKQQESFRARLTPKGWRCGLWPDKLAGHFQFYYPFSNDFFEYLKRPADYMIGSDLLSHEEFLKRFEKYLPIKKRYSAKNAEIDLDEVFSLYLEQYEEAEHIYEKVASSFATCRYLGTIGGGLIHPEVASIFQRHDRVTEALNVEQKKLA